MKFRKSFTLYIHNSPMKIGLKNIKTKIFTASTFQKLQTNADVTAYFVILKANFRRYTKASGFLPTSQALKHV